MRVGGEERIIQPVVGVTRGGRDVSLGIPVIVLVLCGVGTVVYDFLAERAARKELRATMDLYFSPKVSAYVLQKRESISAHTSQISDSSFFLKMPDEVFALMFGTEWFIRKGAPAGIHEDWLAGL